MIILGIITYNRAKYLENLLKSFVKYYNTNYKYTIIIADDGSTDNTHDVISRFDDIYKTTFNITVIKNKSQYIAGQTNSILYESMNHNYECGFMLNDDMEILDYGWDTNYYEAIKKTGYDHLVYFDKRYASKAGKKLKHYKKTIRINKHIALTSKTNAKLCMGCFWTFTRRMINKIGYFNTSVFCGSGYSHMEYTLRACRAKYNDSNYLYDIDDNKLKVYCPENDITYYTVKDGVNVAKNKSAFINAQKDESYIYYNPYITCD